MFTPSCGKCGGPAAVQWHRRPTTTELAALQAAEEEDVRVAVYACTAHAIDPDLAARVHQADCAGPASTTLPDCGCTPDPLPSPAPAPPAPVLPPGW